MDQSNKNNQFVTWPGLTPQAVEKYLPLSLATDLGHLNNTRHHTHKIKPIEEIYKNPPKEDLKQNDIFCCATIADLHEKSVH